MNKKNLMIMAGLMFSSIVTMPSFGENERDYVYMLKNSQQSLKQDQFVQQNYDMLSALFQMHITELQTKLEKISLKKTIAKSVAGIGMAAIARESVPVLVEQLLPNYILSNYDFHNQKKDFLAIKYMISFVLLGASAVNCGVAFYFYDTFKEYQSLRTSLSLDKEIFAELLAIKNIMDLQAANAPTTVSA